MKLSTGAFSLVELMFLMVLISVILAAFMPVITRKISQDSPVNKMQGAISNQCQQFGEACGVCYKNRCLVCELECPSGHALDVNNCRCK